MIIQGGTPIGVLNYSKSSIYYDETAYTKQHKVPDSTESDGHRAYSNDHMLDCLKLTN